MAGLIEVPLQTVFALGPERSVHVMRSLLRAECSYALLPPQGLTISSRLTVADGGIDAEVCADEGIAIPPDCLFKAGLTGFQIKSGTTFKPWTENSIRAELLNGNGELFPEVARLARRRGRYVIVCSGHDLTPQQRNQAVEHVTAIFESAGHAGYLELVEVLGASQLAEFIERYPGTASLLVPDPIQEAWVLDVWQADAHMSNSFEASTEQTELIEQIRAGALGSNKHLRLLGEPGLGKTRLVLEALKDARIAPFTLYFPYGARFGQTKLFRQLLVTTPSKPIVLVIDDLPEEELASIWRHLKARCGYMRIISLDHGHDTSADEDIVRLQVPRLPDKTIREILKVRLGESNELDRWIAICEGSPRVAHAVADNLVANPQDLLRPPSTIPIWSRYIHGYGDRDQALARQIDCVVHHLALFSRFGYEAPVGDEARYIADVVKEVDQTIGWARFQEIVELLRGRRVLQGSRTLFFVPKALHIFLWKQFWTTYGRGFDLTAQFKAMPESLHAWFMNMFRYADGQVTSRVIDEILRPDGIYASGDFLVSNKGASFLNHLAEARPISVLNLLEVTLGRWSDDRILAFKENRQQIVWALEKIAVWPPHFLRAAALLIRLAANENAENSNNSTGTLIGLFRIGPEAAATEASPNARLPGARKLLWSTVDAERRLGLRVFSAAIDTRGIGHRMVGPEYQGLKERAKLWCPATYGEWWDAHHQYFQDLVAGVADWPVALRSEACNTLLHAVQSQIKIEPSRDLAFDVLEILVSDAAMCPTKLNKFFWHYREFESEGDSEQISRRLRSIARRYNAQTLSSRFQRYVIDVEWSEWDESFRDESGKPKGHAKALVRALAGRIVREPARLLEISHLLAPSNGALALWVFGQHLGLLDRDRRLLSPLVELSAQNKHPDCLHAYLLVVRLEDLPLHTKTLDSLFEQSATAWLGATITLRSPYDEMLFDRCIVSLKAGEISPSLFSSLRVAGAMEPIPQASILELLNHLKSVQTVESIALLVDLLSVLQFNESTPFDSEFVRLSVMAALPSEGYWRAGRGYSWKLVCEKLIKWDVQQAMPLLDGLLTSMNGAYALSYDTYVEPFAAQIVGTDPEAAWSVMNTQLARSLPQWRVDLLEWMKGGHGSFDQSAPRGANTLLPVNAVLSWIEQDPAQRAALVAHAAPRTLDEQHGGLLTRSLLSKFGDIDGVWSGISAIFMSGGWSGRTSLHLKKRREQFRQWLGAGFDPRVSEWLEREIQHLDSYIEREEISEERSGYY